MHFVQRGLVEKLYKNGRWRANKLTYKLTILKQKREAS